MSPQERAERCTRAQEGTLSGAQGIVWEEIEPGRAVRILHIHARDDSHVLFTGGAGPGAARASLVTDFTSVPGTAAKWARLNGCRATTRRVLEAVQKAIGKPSSAVV